MIYSLLTANLDHLQVCLYAILETDRDNSNYHSVVWLNMHILDLKFCCILQYIQILAEKINNFSESIFAILFTYEANENYKILEKY